MEILVQIRNLGFKYRFYIIVAFLSLFMTGCYFFGVQGPFTKNDYEIVKVEINNKIFYSPQELSKISKQKLKQERNGNSEEISIETNLDSTTNTTNRQNDALDKAFDNLVERNNLEGNATAPVKPSSLQDLASITIKSTLSLNREQGIINGTMGCNRYTAKFFWQDSTKIVISGSAGTRAMCYPIEIAEFENITLRNFDGIFSIQKTKEKDYSYILDNGIMKVYLK